SCCRLRRIRHQAGGFRPAHAEDQQPARGQKAGSLTDDLTSSHSRAVLSLGTDRVRKSPLSPCVFLAFCRAILHTLRRLRSTDDRSSWHIESKAMACVSCRGNSESYTTGGLAWGATRMIHYSGSIGGTPDNPL